MKSNESQKPLGSLRIAKDVIATIAKIAAAEVNGVAGFAPAAVDFKKIMSTKMPLKPVTVVLSDDIAILDLYILIKSSAKIPTVAGLVQQAVKEAVQSMTGITVSKVNVIISGVTFENQPA